MDAMARLRFDGHIAGAGCSSGLWLVLGRWPVSPFGSFSDAMLQDAAGTRTLLAPSVPVADFVAATYTFDRIRVCHIVIAAGPDRWRVDAGPLQLELGIGRRTPAGWLLRAVPRPLAAAPAWVGLIDPVAGRVMPGVRTRGSAGNGRREWYGALDQHAIGWLAGSWEGRELGTLAPVAPPVGFGFGSVPPSPSLVRVVTTVEL
jgi:hypothetical protein